MRAHLRYALYVAKHKWFVFQAGRRTKAPLWRLLIHDYSKLGSTEWGPYVRRFGSGRSGVVDKASDPEDFHRAWTHHWHLNPHHWEHWLAMNDANQPRPMPMPENFVREMVADWMGASRAITGSWDITDWYESHRDKMVLDVETKQLVQKVFDELGWDLSAQTSGNAVQ